jgi:hypothetical protein
VFGAADCLPEGQAIWSMEWVYSLRANGDSRIDDEPS